MYYLKLRDIVHASDKKINVSTTMSFIRKYFYINIFWNKSSLINIQKTSILHIRVITYYIISLRVLKIKVISIIIKLTVNLICDIDL